MKDCLTNSFRYVMVSITNIYQLVSNVKSVALNFVPKSMSGQSSDEDAHQPMWWV